MGARDTIDNCITYSCFHKAVSHRLPIVYPSSWKLQWVHRNRDRLQTCKHILHVCMYNFTDHTYQMVRDIKHHLNLQSFFFFVFLLLFHLISTCSCLYDIMLITSLEATNISQHIHNSKYIIKSYASIIIFGTDTLLWSLIHYLFMPFIQIGQRIMNVL